jgi:glucosamine kinase
MSFIVADSGSTKCDWAIVDQHNTIQKIKTIGFNPTFHSSDFIYQNIVNAFEPKIVEEVHEIYFFGAGCSNLSEKEIVKQGLQKLFTNAEIIIKHDLEGSAIAALGKEKGISCILGTGSNTCLWDGEKIIETPYVFGNGFILGDEGSGSHLGKTLLKWYLYDLLPELIRIDFEKKWGNRATIFQNVYQKPAPNVYLASLSYFVFEHIDNPVMKKIVKTVFTEFIETNIKRFDNYKDMQVGFVGSIANIFENELKAVCANHEIKTGAIVKEPIDRLIQFYINNPSSTN